MSSAVKKIICYALSHLGVPKSDTNEGNRFCFSFITNKEAVDNLRVLTIFIGTQERESVQYRIRSGTPNVSRNGTVSPGEIIQEQFFNDLRLVANNLTADPPLFVNMQSDTGSSRARNDYTGIIVETVNSSQKIAVSGFNDAAGSSEGFAAVPMFNVSSFTKSYNYAIFADGPESPVSAMVACGHIEAGGITIDNTSPTTVRPQGGYFSRVRRGRMVSSQIDFEEYFNPVLTNNDDEISSLRVLATVPIGFMVGHECGEIPLGKLNCDHLLEQMPPSYTWGYNFLIAPYHSRYAGYIVKVLGGYKTDTNFRLFCDNGTAIAVDNFVDSESRTVNKGVFDITTQSFCTIQSNRPLAVIQYAKGHEVDDDDNNAKEKDLADPQMTWIPSVSQYLNRYLMSNNVSSRPLSAQHFTSNGLYVTVLPECFNTSAILDNGTPIERDASKWSRFYCNNASDVCGYGISVEVSQARHLLRHMDSRCTFGAVMFGWGNQKGYGFPAGFGMAPVGGKYFYTAASE